MTAEEAEVRSLELLRETQTELGLSLNSLGGCVANGLFENYLFYSAAHVNRATEGYVFLRESGRFDASKFLVRTVIEAVLRLQAVREKPELLYRIAFAEFVDDKKWFRPLGKGTMIDRQWEEFREAYRSAYPEHEPMDKALHLRDVAKLAGLDGYYDSHYRLYCRFTHAAFRAITGDLDRLEWADNRTMITCATATLDALSSIGAAAPKLPDLRKRLSAL